MENNQNNSNQTGTQFKKPIQSFRPKGIMPPPYYRSRPVPINKFTGGCKSGKCGMSRPQVIEPKKEINGND